MWKSNLAANDGAGAKTTEPRVSNVAGARLHPATLAIQRKLANAWSGMKCSAEAEDLLQNTLEAGERELPRAHPLNAALERL